MLLGRRLAKRPNRRTSASFFYLASVIGIIVTVYTTLVVSERPSRCVPTTTRPYPVLGISSLLTKLQGLRDLARESGPDDVFLGLIEACA
jgi:hypothetical protein